MPDWPVIPAFHGSAGSNLPPSRVAVHATVTPCARGIARAVARNLQSPSSGGSYHRIADPGEVVITAPDDRIVWHAPPNTRSFGIAMCDPMDGNPARWRDADHVAMMGLTATETRGWCDTYDIPITRVEAPGLRRGLRGLTGHHDVSQTWGLSDHWDPGPHFPWATFLGLVAGVVDKEDAMSVETEAVMRENWLRLIEQQKRQAASDRALVAASVPTWYRTYLGREATTRSVESWLRQHDRGYSPARIEQAIRTSREAREYEKARRAG